MVWVGVLSGILVVGALLWFPVIGKVVQRLGKKRVMVCIIFFLFSFERQSTSFFFSSFLFQGLFRCAHVMPGALDLCCQVLS